MSNIKKIKLSDLNSVFDLKQWIRTSANLFHSKNIEKKNMLIIITYLKDVIKKSNLKDKSGWFDAIIELEDRVERSDDKP